MLTMENTQAGDDPRARSVACVGLIDRSHSLRLMQATLRSTRSADGTVASRDGQSPILRRGLGRVSRLYGRSPSMILDPAEVSRRPFPSPGGASRLERVVFSPGRR